MAHNTYLSSNQLTVTSNQLEKGDRGIRKSGDKGEKSTASVVGGKIEDKPPKPHFGHSGNKVDELFISAQEELQKGEFVKAYEKTIEAIRLLQNVDFEELDNSDFPVADGINQTEVAIGVLEWLIDKGVRDKDISELVRQLKTGKNGLELKQALGYKGSKTRPTFEVEQGPGRIDGSANSPLTPASELGGVDFRNIEFTSQTSDSNISEPKGKRPDDLKTARTLVELAIEYRNIPEISRIKDWLRFALESNNFSQERNKILIAITGIFRLEEEECKPADTLLYKLLILLEQDKPDKELLTLLK